jgi:ABC-2 type transport system permease protein
VRLQEQDVPLSGSVEPALERAHNPLVAFYKAVQKTLVIAGLELRKLRHDPTELIDRKSVV